MITSISDIDGIERNAASRFIDFSCSTVWEKSILKIENFVRAIILRGKDNDSETFSFLGTKFKISFHCDTLPVDARSYFSSLFDIENRYILVSRPGSNWLDCTTSQKHTLFSILVTSLQSCADFVHDNSGRVPPIFFTMANDECIHSTRTLDIMGYQICKAPSSSLIVNFSSINQNYSLLEDDKEEFRHVDSLSQLFLKHLASYHLGMDSSQFKSRMIVQVREQSSIKVQNFFVRNVPYKSRIFPIIPVLLKRIKASSLNRGDRPDASVIKSINLSAVLVYPPMKLTSIADNENYTTLVPAKQSPNSWSILASFTSPLVESKRSTSVTTSTCVRRLLASFIFSKSTSYVHHLRAIDDKVKNIPDADLLIAEKSQSIAAVLSQKSIETVRSMCTYSEEKESEDQYINNLLTLLFQEKSCDTNRGLDLGQSSSIPATATFLTETELMIEKCVTNTVEFLSLYALCSGTLQSFSCSGTLWSRFLLALRSRWDEASPLPGMNGPRPGYLGSNIRINGPKGSLRKQLMWHDILEQKEILSHFCSDKVIDLSLPILAQNLQALQFCVVVKNVGVLYNPFGDSLCLQRRLPLTSDAIAQRKYILQKLKPPPKTDRVTHIMTAPLCASASFDSDCSNEFLDSKEGKDEEAIERDETHEEGVGEGEGDSNSMAYERDEGYTEVEKEVEKEDGLIGSESSAESSFPGTFQGTVESSTISAEHVQVKDADSGTANVAVVKKDEEVNWRMMDDDTPVSMISSNFDISPSQLQYWRVEHDVVISDMKAWKAENSIDNDDNGDDDNSFDEFIEWYTGRDVGEEEGEGESESESRDDYGEESDKFHDAAANGDGDGDGYNDQNDKNRSKGQRKGSSSSRSWEPVPSSLLVVWSHLWQLCSSACPASEQKPLFNAETEVEKILGYMGSINPTQLAAELVLSALTSAPPLLSSLIEEHVAMVIALIRQISPGVSTDSVSTVLGQEEELQILCATIIDIQKELKDELLNIAAVELKSETASEVNTSILQLIDRAISMMERLEDYSCRVKALCGAISHAIGLPSSSSSSSSSPSSSSSSSTSLPHSKGGVNVDGLDSFLFILPSIIHTLSLIPHISPVPPSRDVYSSVYSPTNSTEVEFDVVY